MAHRESMWEQAGYETRMEFMQAVFRDTFSGPSIWETSVRPAMEVTQFAARAVITGGASVGTAFFLNTVDVLNDYFEYLRFNAS